jgi:hypothetical protein
MANLNRPSGSQAAEANLQGDWTGDNTETVYARNDRLGSKRAYGQTDNMRAAREEGQIVLEDAIITLGVLLGGALGYLGASAFSKSRRNASMTSRRAGISRSDHGSGHSYEAPSHRSVEKDETTDLIASSKVEGTPVYNRQGETLGEVYNFMVGKRSGQVAYAVMSFGGFLGIGQKYHALPWNVLTYDTSKKGYVIDADRDRLMNAPNYSAGEDPFSTSEYGQQVRNYWYP